MFVLFALAGSGIIVATAPLRSDSYKTVCVASGLVIASIAALPLMSLATCYLLPRTFDGCLLSIDQHLGLRGFELARFVYSTPWFHNLLILAYGSMPFVVALAWVLEPSDVLLRALLMASVAGTACYFIVPAIGPARAFAAFPWSTPHPGWTLIKVSQKSPRNSFPSLHFGWATLLYMNATRRWLRAAMGVFLLLTALATVGCGEHYFIDLIAAVPFCVAVQWWAERPAGKQEVHPKCFGLYTLPRQEPQEEMAVPANEDRS